jgi:hypothetical protein
LSYSVVTFSGQRANAIRSAGPNTLLEERLQKRIRNSALGTAFLSRLHSQKSRLITFIGAGANPIRGGPNSDDWKTPQRLGNPKQELQNSTWSLTGVKICHTLPFLMSFCFLRCERLLASACAVLLCVSPMAVAQQQSRVRSQPIIFSETANSSVLSNLNNTAPRRDAVRNLEGQIQKPDDLIRPNDSMGQLQQPVLIWSPAPVLGSKKLMKLLRQNQDEKENWAFMNPEDKQLGQTAEEIFKISEYGSDGEETKKKTAVEKFYERADRESNAATDRKRGAGENADSDDQNRDGSGEKREKDQLGATRFFDADSTITKSSQNQSDNSFSSDSFSAGMSWNPFGSGQAQTDVRDRGHDERMEQFQKLLVSSGVNSSDSSSSGFNPSGTGAGSFSSPLGNGWLETTPAAPAAIAPVFAPANNFSTFNSSPSVFGTLSRPQGMPEASAAPAFPSSLSPLLPAQEKPRSTMPQPVFSMPQRKF